ncbi:50S ribosomal protein L29 [bacterium]|nr:50S ribosomal protein L29 [bacterium]
MAKKKAHDLRDLTVEDLEGLEREKAEELMDLRLRLRLRQVDNALAIRTARRELATIKTVITEKKRATT